MSTINKDLYDALMKAGCDDGLATKAATSEMEINTDIAEIKARLSVVDKLQWVVLVMLIASFLRDILV